MKTVFLLVCLSAIFRIFVALECWAIDMDGSLMKEQCAKHALFGRIYCITALDMYGLRNYDQRLRQCGKLLNLTANAMFESAIFYWARKGIEVEKSTKEEYINTLMCTECGVDLCNDANPLNGQTLVADVFGPLFMVIGHCSVHPHLVPPPLS